MPTVCQRRGASRWLRGLALLAVLVFPALSACSQQPSATPQAVAAALECSPEWLAALGFDPESQVSLQAYARRALDSQSEMQCRGGSYVPLDCGDQIQLWFQRNPEGQIIAVEPHLAAPPHFATSLVRQVRHDGAPLLSGGFICYMLGNPKNLKHGRFPIVFDDPAFGLDLPTTLPIYRNVQLIAYALRVTAYPTLAAFKQYRTINFGPEQIQSHGIWAKRAVLADSPPSRITMTARVLSFSKRRNPLTGGQYVWARVRTRGQVLDLVARPNAVLGTLRQGGILVAVCDLCGRVLTF
jgi:hypothetical protein